VFVNFNLLLQREDPVIPLMYDVIIDLVTLVLQSSVDRCCSAVQNKAISVSNTANQLDNDNLFLGFGLRGKLIKALDDGDIIDVQYQQFMNAARACHVDVAVYIIKVLPFDDHVLRDMLVYLTMDTSRGSHLTAWIILYSDSNLTCQFQTVTFRH